jgi:prepilin-type N-terminal cleavage/methylation domain-containing protein
MIKKIKLAFGKQGSVATAASGRSASVIQRGFSLIEMVVVLSIIAVLASLISTQFSGDSSKATKLLSDMTNIKNGLNRAKFDMGGIPNRLDSLWDQSEVEAADMFSGVAGTTTWAGPYVERLPHTAGVLNFNSLADGVTVAVGREVSNATVNGGAYNPGSVYILTASGVPRGIASEFMRKCTGNDSTVTNANGLATSNCRVATTDEISTVTMRVADSR